MPRFNTAIRPTQKAIRFDTLPDDLNNKNVEQIALIASVEKANPFSRHGIGCIGMQIEMMHPLGMPTRAERRQDRLFPIRLLPKP
jgi:hypothetical protein